MIKMIMLMNYQESRKRKKRRLEELQRSVLFLTHENHQLREQNELLRQMLVGRLPGSPPGTLPAGAAAGAQIAQPVVEVRGKALVFDDDLLSPASLSILTNSSASFYLQQTQPQTASGQPGVVGIPTP